MAAGLESLVTRNRVVAVVGPDEEGSPVERQRVLLEGARDGLEERDVKVVYLRPGDPTATDLGVANATFATVLVGKDGEAKSRWSHPVEPATIFAEIDAMPMRQREMKR